ncbi:MULTISPECIES: HEAT repeat domain-containing protein [Paenibacillus]|uniref:HEAT repeat domain-containing protein n=1 Tax=Paenibacillus TaxID=44249 RepID=UPI001AEA39EA|nr:MULTISPECIES: HEAT repeat domain-containing protein [Paenibacillus]MBY0117961.1 HEAT repeat domain-containing protein [Paenibacillus xylanexedens]QZN78491.1 HEAT repeat domain-containing protein [Paenibacillus sp. DR312]
MFADLYNRRGITLPATIVEELEVHLQKQKDYKFFLRLMQRDEIVESLDDMAGIEVYHNMIPLWTDDHSNYIGLHVEGACQYRISYISHEETDIAPAYRSAGSFIRELERNPHQDWDELKKDYPSDIELSRDQMNEDLSCIHELNDVIESDPRLNEDVRCQYIYCIMALTPQSHLDSLMKYIDDEDMYVQERACQIMGFHRYTPAREKLVEVSKKGMHNGKLAAKRALAKMREQRKENKIK